MNRQRIYLLLVLALLLASGCSDPEHSGPEQVPIELHAADGGEVTTKADQAITQAFGTTVFASKRAADYSGLSSPVADEWKKNTEVQTDGSVALPGNPAYPVNGDWLYLVAVAPQATTYDDSNGKVTYTLTGGTDLMYAAQIRGNRWDGSRFSSNTDDTVTPLEYTHLLTQLTFKAKKETSGGLTVKVKKVTVTAENSVTLSLADGSTAFSGSGELSLEFPEGGTDISSTDETGLTGALLLPPLVAGSKSPYKITVETSIGTFSGLPVSFGSPGAPDTQFAPGYSHEITLNIGDRELEILSVTVASWTPVVESGELDLIGK